MAGKAEKQGVVVSDKMMKSVVVSTERRVQHDVYGKTQKRTSTFVAHDENNEAKVGDTVTLIKPGTGGAFAWCDRSRNLAFAYCTNFQREGPGIGPRGAALGVAAGGGKRPDWLK